MGLLPVNPPVFAESGKRATPTPVSSYSGRLSEGLAGAHVGPDPTLLSPAATSDQLRSSLVRMSRSKLGCGKVFEDRASGARADRAGLQAALDYVRDGEVLVVWKLD